MSRGFGWLLIAVAVVPLAALLVLYTWQVPLGLPGKFTYLYSPIVPRRAAVVPAALVACTVISAGVWLLGAAAAPRRRIGGACVAVGVGALGCWAFASPPQYLSQHNFNMNSPSHDGAFLAESRYLLERGVMRYLADFPERTRTPREVMRGTRVLSNPPATTLLAGAVRSTLDSSPSLTTRMFDFWIGDPEVSAEDRLPVTRAIIFSLVLHACWLLAWPLWFAIARLAGLAPALAAVAATIAWVTPATLGFTPGKDPGQLFTTALPLLAWMLALRARGNGTTALFAASAGGLAIAVAYVGLIHLWLAIIVLAATLIAAHDRRRRILVFMLMPAIAGALLVLGGLAAAGVDWVTTMRAVAAAQALVTRGPDAMPWSWQLLGAPLFLLLAGPGVLLALVGLARPGISSSAQTPAKSDAPPALFRVAALLSLAVMSATVIFTNAEASRLWIPFVPLLVIGAAQAIPPWLASRTHLLAAILLIHLACSLVEWSFMDLRESENRLAIRANQGARMFD